MDRSTLSAVTRPLRWPRHAPVKHGIPRRPTVGQLRRLRDGGEWSIDQQVYRFGGDGGDDGSDVLDLVDPWCVEAVGPCLGLRDQPSDRLVDVGTSADESLGSAGEQQRVGLVTRGVLDREPGDACLGGQFHVRADLGRLCRVTTLESSLPEYAL